MRVETIHIESGASVFEYVSADHKLNCRQCFNSTSLTTPGLRSCDKHDAHFFVEEKKEGASQFSAFCLPRLKRSKHAKQVALLLSASLKTIQDMQEQRKLSVLSASSIAVHNTRNITASINSKLLGLLDETRLAKSKNKVDYIQDQLRYRPQEFAREILSILKAITQANFEYTVLDYLSGTRPLTQQDFGSHKVHTLCVLCFYLYDTEFEKKGINVKIGDSHQNSFVNFSSVKTIIGQLFENALKYMEPNSELEVSFPNNNPEFITIKLCMNSLAFKNEEIPRLISIEQRGENAISHNFTGKGLGLAMANSLTILNYGFIQIETDETSQYVVDGIPYSKNTFSLNLLRKQNQLIEILNKGRTRRSTLR